MVTKKGLYQKYSVFRRWIRKNKNYYFILTKSFFTKTRDKVVYIDLSEVALNRYLANLVIYFEKSGYTTFIPKNKNLIDELCATRGEWRYSNLTLKCSIKLAHKEKINRNLRVLRLSNDYYCENKNSYRLPIGLYPFNYFNDFEEDLDVSPRRINSLFFSGNIDAKSYSKFDSNNRFNIPPRLITYKLLQKDSRYVKLTKRQDFTNYLASPRKKAIIAIDKSTQFSLPFDDYKRALNTFDFFLALPGIEVPESHNLIEAMLHGCIPIIHREYAETLEPVLENEHNCFIFENLDDLNDVLFKIFDINNETRVRIRQNVTTYYLNYFAPKSIVDRIMNETFDSIRIQAELISLSLIR